MVSIKKIFKSCFFCFRKKDTCKDDLFSKSPNKKKEKSNKFLSCFSVQEEFDIIDSNEVPNKFNSIVKTVNEGTQTESTVKTNTKNNEIENDFIITDSYLEKK